MALTPRYTKHELAVLLAAIHPEEDRHKFTRAKWNGDGFRHFRDPKVVCLEHFRPKSKQPRPQQSGHKPAA